MNAFPSRRRWMPYAVSVTAAVLATAGTPTPHSDSGSGPYGRETC